jgi:hypothetical protein
MSRVIAAQGGRLETPCAGTMAVETMAMACHNHGID